MGHLNLYLFTISSSICGIRARASSAISLMTSDVTPFGMFLLKRERRLFRLVVVRGGALARGRTSKWKIDFGNSSTMVMVFEVYPKNRSGCWATFFLRSLSSSSAYLEKMEKSGLPVLGPFAAVGLAMIFGDVVDVGDDGLEEREREEERANIKERGEGGAPPGKHASAASKCDHSKRNLGTKLALLRLLLLFLASFHCLLLPAFETAAPHVRRTH